MAIAHSSVHEKPKVGPLYPTRPQILLSPPSQEAKSKPHISAQAIISVYHQDNEQTMAGSLKEWEIVWSVSHGGVEKCISDTLLHIASHHRYYDS